MITQKLSTIQKIELTELQAKILEILGKGKENALTGKDLKKRLPNYSERKIRKTIESLRHEKYPILSSATQPFGYYLPGNQQEVDECLKMMRSYIIELCKIRRDIKLGAKEKDLRFIQLPLLRVN